jgi:hypothetical protein
MDTVIGAAAIPHQIVKPCMERNRGMDQMTSRLDFQFLESNIKEIPGKVMTALGHFFINKHLLNSSESGSKPESEDTNMNGIQHSPELGANLFL